MEPTRPASLGRIGMGQRHLGVPTMSSVRWSWILLGGLFVGACDSGDGVASGGGAMTGTSATGPTSGDGGPVASEVVASGLVTAGAWSGYGFTATDGAAYATIVPSCSAACSPPFTGSDFCMSGTVFGRSDYAGFAMLGWNVAQPNDGGAVGSWDVAGTGVTITVSNPSDVALRVQLQAPGGAHVASLRWCAPLTSGQMIPWSSFANECWNSGTAAGNTLTSGQAIENAAIVVPGAGASIDTPFNNVCLVNITLQ